VAKKPPYLGQPQTHFNLEDILDFQNTSPTLKSLLNGSQIKNLEDIAEYLTVIQCRVDNCKKGIEDEDRFWICQPDVMGSEYDYPSDKATRISLREALAPYDPLEAFGITEADIERYEITVIKSIAKLPPLDPLPEIMTKVYNKPKPILFFVPTTSPYPN
jgi:hypothetical protein